MNPIDTYQLATGGQNLSDTYTLASNGILVRVYIDVLPSDNPYLNVGGYLVKGIGKNLRKKERQKYDERKEHEHEKEVDRRKITVCATIDGREFCETLIVLDKPKLTIDDIKVDVLTSEKEPKIKITVTI
jgi:hypothetical protein